MKNIAIFASGSGTNAENIIRYFKNHPDVNVSVVISNKPEAKVVERAKNLNVPVGFVSERSFFESSDFVKHLGELDINLIVLAGFLWKIPDLVLKAYPDKIINIHPSLLPKYGGKGMYGSKVHQAVLDAGEQKAGITIHYVNEHYDDGEIIFQKSIDVKSDDTCESLAERVHELEHRYYPEVIEKLLVKTTVR